MVCHVVLRKIPGREKPANFSQPIPIDRPLKLMKRNPFLLLQVLTAAALLLGAASPGIAQTTNFYVNGFTSAGNTPDTTPAGCGVWYGGSTILWDPGTVD